MRHALGKSKRSVLFQIDETFVLELALVGSLTEGAGAERLRTEVLDRYPISKGHV